MHLIFLTSLLFTLSVMAAGEMPVSFTLTGRLFESPTSTNPLLEQNVELRVQILNSTKTCVLYDQKQLIHTDTTEGNFAVHVGTIVGDTKRVVGSDRGNEMSVVFQNTAPIPATCAGASANATAISRAGRHLRVSVKLPGQLEDVLNPDIFVGHVPTALVSETLGGLSKDQFLQLGTGTSELTQSNLETIFSATKFPVLEGLVAGTTTTGGINSDDNYVITANADSVGTGVIQFAIGSSVKAEITNAGDFIANQKIGVGTGLPSFDLSFGGTANRTIGIERGTGAELKIASGGAAAGSSNSAGGDLVLSSGLSTGTAGSRILFQTPTPGGTDNNPVTKMILDSFGNLGINNSAPSRALHISSSASPTVLLDYTTGGTDQKRRYMTSSSDGALAFGKFSDNMGTTTEHVRILSNGNVGIGTTNPGSKLEVAGVVRVGSQFSGSVHPSAPMFANATPAIEVGVGDTNAESLILMRRFNSGSGSTLRRLGFMMKMTNEGNLGESTKNGGIILDTSAAWAGLPSLSLVTADVKRLTIEAGGNIGIGTTSPGAKLEISGSSGTASLLNVNTTTSLASDSAFQYFNNGRAWIGYDGPRTALDIGAGGAKSITFSTNSSGPLASAERMRIDNIGNVGIGKTNPSTLLDVNGTATANRMVAGGAPVVAWTPVTKTSNYSVTTSDVYKYFLVSGTSTMTLPSPSAVGAGYTIGFNNVGAGTVTVNPNASETINGGANYAMSAGGAVTLITDGVSWFFFNQKLPPCTDNAGNLSPCTTVANRYVTDTAGSDITSWSNSGAGTSVTATIPTGFYSGKTVTFTDPELLPSRIRTGYTVFGVTGNGSTLPSTGQIVWSSVNRQNPTAANCTSPACPAGFTNMGCWVGYSTYSATSGHYENATLAGSINSPSSSTCSGTNPTPTANGYNYAVCSRLCIKY